MHKIPSSFICIMFISRSRVSLLTSTKPEEDWSLKVQPNQGQLPLMQNSKQKWNLHWKQVGSIDSISWVNQWVMNKWMMLETYTSLDCKWGGRKKETQTWGGISSGSVWLICQLCMANKLLDVSLFYLHHNILAMLLYYHQYMNVNLPLCIDIVVDICKAWGVGIYLWCVDKDVMLMLKDWIYFTIYNTLWYDCGDVKGLFIGPLADGCPLWPW